MKVKLLIIEQKQVANLRIVYMFNHLGNLFIIIP